VSGAGLSWVLVERSNFPVGNSRDLGRGHRRSANNVFVMAQPGNGTAYHGSMTVTAFTNASGPGIVGRTGAPSGPPDIPVPGVSAGNWVFVVGNDWDCSVARTPVSGQVLVDQKLD